jgi:hypothetical protein
MPRLSLGLGVQNIRKVGGGAAPSGINVATTNAIVLSGLTGGWTDLNGTYTKSGDPTNVFNGGVDGEATGAVFFNSAYTGGNRDGAAIWYGPIIFGSGNGWQITWYDDNRFRLGSIESADTTTVPVSGYSNFAGYTGTITLTAAPSGLPAASTGNLIITFADETNKLYTKINNAYWYGFIDSGGEEVVLQWTGTIWTLQRVVGGEYSGPFGSEANNNTSTSATIPTTGWVYTVTGYGSPTITITAA